ncbi:hypothetical protein D9613_008120 [Agrocybe pediades]|uniref:Mucoidy inhibitor A n=1 Tax=Agrocybe pediades TaxID=84607 RepID=A0A8H4VMI3_9AGAR|nr:hypothetical protein D9613_008120 [Agrocybe pediades]
MTSPSHIFKASEHAIKSVTVFKSSKAEAVRVFTVPLKKGQNKVQITDLSSSIDTRSLRVSGLGGAARLFDVVCTLDSSALSAVAPSGQGDTSTEKLRTMYARRQALESEKQIREKETELLLKYGQTLSGEHVNPGQMSTFLDQYVTRGQKTLESITQLEEKIADIDQLIKSEEYKVSIRKGSANGRVDVVISADDDISVDLKLTYIVSNAEWKPVYELHASADNGKPSSSVSLHYRARISQETGEDWNNTSLTLSTIAAGTTAKSVPELKRRRILPKANQGYPTIPQQMSLQPGEFIVDMQLQPTQYLPQQQHHQRQLQYQQQQAAQQQQVAQQHQAFQQLQQQQPQNATLPAGPYGAYQAVAANSRTLSQKRQYNEDSLMEDDYDTLEIEQPSSITENKTIVSETPIAVSFSVHGESTIPSDGVEHQVSVAELPFAAKISYITVPRVDPRVFLQCEVTNSSEYRLLPGPVTVIFDDSYVSTSSIDKAISTGDSFECTLGDDPSTQVSYTRSSKTVKSNTGAFSENTNTTTYTTKISVHNKHQFPISRLIIREAVPVANDKRVRVILRKPEGLAEAKDGQVVNLKDNGLCVGWTKVVDGSGGTKEGKFEWTWNVNSGAKVMVEAEWDVKSTGDNEWIEG